MELLTNGTAEMNVAQILHGAAEEYFPAPVSAESPSNISPNPSKVIFEIFKKKL
jgi:hypothetical protein